ncbi:MAG TPA: glycosyltransferase family 2 protein [Acidimicrobiales bacterium]|nr:glycosyltransferase family 2 protein [Acidimicrobiales bacterium]
MRPSTIVRRALRRPLPPARQMRVVSEPNPEEPDLLGDFRLFAILGSWMEEDVVEATIRNAFAQGVETVYLIDNDSTDATVDRAIAAGATLVERFHTELYEERVRILLMNSAVARISLASGEDHIWWLWMDADEFPEGPDGLTIREYLGTLDRRFRIVGGSYYNHFPVEKPESLPGFHPVDLQPMCELFAPVRPRYCFQPHWKHPLQRFDRAGPFMMSIMGFHTATLLMGEEVLEPTGGIVGHHVQYREESNTRARMELLCGGGDRNQYHHATGNKSMRRRFKTLDAIYSQSWAEADNLGAGHGVDPKPWVYESPPIRWYDASDLKEAVAAWRLQQALVD